ncbi:PIF1-like helicase domain-containing protein [Ditylenchus destructor]|uniref:ATP-dependent DNA helicase n=1 Tax=Ditylenchus destructor TaxID=166010 RepID=A0AAD4QTB2_9BILA|nr:PIF1-like helicase domain-containing protein [Ditylenchus destructor]
MLKLPLDVGPETTSGIQIHMPEATLLKEAFMVVWDESPMSPKYVLDMLDKKLREIMQTDEPFGGKLIMLGGDFRQLLPVKPYAIPSEVVQLTSKKAKTFFIYPVENVHS